MYVTILVYTWPAQDTIKPNYYIPPKCLPTTHRHVDIVPHMIGSSSIINARRIPTRVMVVCLCVCYQSIDFLRGLYNKVDIPDDFTLISKGFQLRNFSKMLSFRVTASIVHFSALSRPFLSYRDCKWRTLHMWLRILPGSLGMRCESI